MAEINQNIIEQFDAETRARIARLAELRDLFWGERRAYRAGEYATEEEYEAGMDRTTALFAEILTLSAELRTVGYIPPPHRDEPTDAEREAALETLRRLNEESRERRNQQAANAAPEVPQNEETESEGEEENEADQNS